MTSNLFTGMDSETTVDTQQKDVIEDDALPIDVNHLDFDDTHEIPHQKAIRSNTPIKRDALESVSIALDEVISTNDSTGEFRASEITHQNFTDQNKDNKVESSIKSDKLNSGKGRELDLDDTLDLEDTQERNDSLSDVDKIQEPSLLDGEEQQNEKTVDLDKIHEELLDEVFD